MTASADFNDAAPKEADEEWFGLEDGAFKSVPRPPAEQRGEVIAIRGILPLPIAESEAYRKNQDILDAAMIILSQSPTARKLAATAIGKGYSVIVDPPVISGAGVNSENVALGSTDALNKHINVKGIDDPVLLAMVIAHELTHVSQIEKGGMPFVVAPYHPLAAIKNLMAMEGDARAHEFLIALELSYKMKDDPAERLIFPSAIDVAANNIGGIMPKRVIEAFKDKFPDGINKEEVMARIFKGFYASADLRGHYENTVLHAISTVEALHPGSYADEKKFTGDITAQEILKKIDSHSVPYAQRYAKYLALDDDNMKALWPETLQRLAAIEEKRRENPLTQNDRSWTDAPDMAGYIVRETPAPPKAAAPAP